ncbi:hypothetical protein C4F51_18185 [Cellvibrio sp. KB43]|uniref:Uncharacterized protein n=1 Tax=Cellvibrio polysaccharolyticus TaxID=2082724 RepID=A0A928YUV1_9GAMM|nr:hypothetical protein [Cellvibrio polysaccharolyticus]
MHLAQISCTNNQSCFFYFFSNEVIIKLLFFNEEKFPKKYKTIAISNILKCAKKLSLIFSTTFMRKQHNQEI